MRNRVQVVGGGAARRRRPSALRSLRRSIQRAGTFSRKCQGNAFKKGESPLDLETRADSILQRAGRTQPAEVPKRPSDDFGPPGVEIARLQILDWNEADRAAADAIADPSMEFTLPPGELDRIFVELKKKRQTAQSGIDARPRPRRV